MEPRPEEPASRWFSSQEAIRCFLEIERFDLAETRSRDFCKEFPDDPVGHFYLGLALLRQRKLDEAEPELHEALRLDSSNPGAYQLMGSLKRDRRLYREAEEFYLMGLGLSPSSVPLLTEYAGLMFLTGYKEKAERLYREALRHEPENESVHNALALLFNDQRDFLASEVHLEKSGQVAPDGRTFHLAKGLVAYNTGRAVEARDHLLLALRMDPTDEEVRKLYFESRKACRWYFVPLYFFSILAQRLPGSHWTIWIGVCLFIRSLSMMKIPSLIVVFLGLSWLMFCLYTWIINPIANWIEKRSED